MRTKEVAADMEEQQRPERHDSEDMRSSEIFKPGADGGGEARSPARQQKPESQKSEKSPPIHTTKIQPTGDDKISDLESEPASSSPSIFSIASEDTDLTDACKCRVVGPHICGCDCGCDWVLLHDEMCGFCQKYCI
ncbi:Fc.00g005550.m01.CDS01 [Cosmosporella sp. VM-42]